mmetsp:Transcript_46872/g.150590  ORF Transcript_46872/g.150590 Transcript_46872/m.150590 type:complete len:314 (+) Transcript_46872:3-944(+)
MLYAIRCNCTKCEGPIITANHHSMSSNILHVTMRWWSSAFSSNMTSTICPGKPWISQLAAPSAGCGPQRKPRPGVDSAAGQRAWETLPLTRIWNSSRPISPMWKWPTNRPVPRPLGSTTGSSSSAETASQPQNEPTTWSTSREDCASLLHTFVFPSCPFTSTVSTPSLARRRTSTMENCGPCTFQPLPPSPGPGPTTGTEGSSDVSTRGYIIWPGSPSSRKWKVSSDPAPICPMNSQAPGSPAHLCIATGFHSVSEPATKKPPRPSGASLGGNLDLLGSRLQKIDFDLSSHRKQISYMVPTGAPSARPSMSQF